MTFVDMKHQKKKKIAKKKLFTLHIKTLLLVLPSLCFAALLAHLHGGVTLLFRLHVTHFIVRDSICLQVCVFSQHVAAQFHSYPGVMIRRLIY